jgi:carbonic anhydrase
MKQQLFRCNLLPLALLLFSTMRILASTEITTEQALDSLKVGNQRFVKLNPSNLDYDKQIEHTKDGQHPFVAVLSCMDSRVPPEIIFDQGIGSVFVVREAGNVTSPNSLGSLEYAVNVKKVKLVVVLGHSKCGAVEAAVNKAELGEYKNLEQLIEQIKPAVCSDNILSSSDNIYQCTEKNNVKMSIASILRNSSPIAKAVKNNEVKIIGAYYDVATGVVTFDKEYTSE